MSARSLLARVATLSGSEVRADHHAAVARVWKDAAMLGEGLNFAELSISGTGCTCGDLELYADPGALWAVGSDWAIDIHDRLLEALGTEETVSATGPTEVEQLRDLVKRAVSGAGHRGDYQRPRWSWVCQTFGIGSTRAVELCHRYGLDPDEMRGNGEAEPAPKCTGVAARWCAVHGDCSCPRDDGSDWRRTLTDQSCPLHSDASTHADGEAPS